MHTYGVYKLTETSPAQTFIEPITSTEVKARLRLPDFSPADPAQEAQITMFITGARIVAEILQGREIVRKQQDFTFDVFPAGEIALRGPLVSVDTVMYKDSSGVVHPTAENTDYIVDLARGLVLPPYGKSWPSFTPWPSSAITIQFTSGKNTCSEIIRIGMLNLISAWFAGGLPFELGVNAVQEYPLALRDLLSFGAVEHVR